MFPEGKGMTRDGRSNSVVFEGRPKVCWVGWKTRYNMKTRIYQMLPKVTKPRRALQRKTFGIISLIQSLLITTILYLLVQELLIFSAKGQCCKCWVDYSHLHYHRKLKTTQSVMMLGPSNFVCIHVYKLL